MRYTTSDVIPFRCVIWLVVKRPVFLLFVGTHFLYLFPCVTQSLSLYFYLPRCFSFYLHRVYARTKFNHRIALNDAPWFCAHFDAFPLLARLIGEKCHLEHPLHPLIQLYTLFFSIFLLFLFVSYSLKRFTTSPQCSIHFFSLSTSSSIITRFDLYQWEFIARVATPIDSARFYNHWDFLIRFTSFSNNSFYTFDLFVCFDCN